MLPAQRLPRLRLDCLDAVLCASTGPSVEVLESAITGELRLRLLRASLDASVLADIAGLLARSADGTARYVLDCLHLRAVEVSAAEWLMPFYLNAGGSGFEVCLVNCHLRLREQLIRRSYKQLFTIA